jgi:hypothetical protein
MFYDFRDDDFLNLFIMLIDVEDSKEEKNG